MADMRKANTHGVFSRHPFMLQGSTLFRTTAFEHPVCTYKTMDSCCYSRRPMLPAAAVHPKIEVSCRLITALIF